MPNVPVCLYERRFAFINSKFEELFGSSRSVIDRQLVETKHPGIPGRRVLRVSNGREGLKMCDARPGPDGDGNVDLLITDLMMPEMDGAELLEAWRTSGWVTSALALTGHLLRDGDRTALKEAGLKEVSQKPFDAKQLARVVRSALDGA